MSVRTTITLPEELLKAAKIAAVHERKSLSAVITEALEEKLAQQQEKGLPTRDPMTLLGKYSLGIKSKLRRKDLYADYLRHKVPR